LSDSFEIFELGVRTTRLALDYVNVLYAGSICERGNKYSTFASISTTFSFARL